MLAQVLSLILAVGLNGAIGRRGGLPWSWPEDARYFDDTTRGHAVIMGRRTWEERGEPLADRHNVVVSSRFVPPPGVFVARTLDEALAKATSVDASPFVIGGARLFEEALPRADRVHVTTIPEAPDDADTFFQLDRAPFRVVSSRRTRSGLLFEVLDRINAPARPR
jgi:dihydrofolate reductase